MIITIITKCLTICILLVISSCASYTKVSSDNTNNDSNTSYIVSGTVTVATTSSVLSLSKNVNYTIYWLKQIKDFYNPLYENLSEMKINNNNEMELILSDNPTQIFLGRSQLFKKINTLKEFEVKLQPNRLTDFSYLDMRYKNQIIAKNRKI